MASALELCYTIAWPNHSCDGLIKFHVQDGAKVQELLDVIRARWGTSWPWGDEDTALFKCGDLPRGCSYDRLLEWLRENSFRRMMQPGHQFREYFPTAPAPVPAPENDEKIDIVVVTESVLDTHSVFCPISDKYILKVCEERFQLATGMVDLPDPADGVSSIEGIMKCYDEDRIHAHRPADNYGPPTSLFNSALAKLKHNLDHISELEELDPSSDLLEQCDRFIFIAGRIYDDEYPRQLALVGLIEMFSGERSKWIQRTEHGIISARTWGYPEFLILESKNEDGLDGNASLQALMSFTRVISQRKYKLYTERSNWPVILIGISGPRLEISTAVFTDGVYVDKLLSLELYADIWLEDNILRLGRTMQALSLAMSELKEYYSTIERNSDLERTVSHLYPNPVAEDQGSQIPKLNYMGKLLRTGRRVPFLKAMKDGSERHVALYLARMVLGSDDAAREVDVVVKFAPFYNERAHRMLAERHLAPKLHYCGRVLGGLYMVVMDYVVGQAMDRANIPKDYTNIYENVKTAIELLHAENLVFGDLQEQNVLVKPDGGAVLIDFDIVGEHKVDRYPANWSTDLPSRRAEGVERYGFLDKAHDIFALGKIRQFLELVAGMSGGI